MIDATIARLAERLRPALDWQPARAVRRNHGLEHATIHLLARKIRGLRLSGRSSAFGFMLIGEVPTAQVEAAVRDALARMKKGEASLAVHPNCGTNLVTIGTLTTLAAYAGLGLKRERVLGNRFGGVLALMMLAVLVGGPLGMALQKHITTSGEPGDLELVSVTRRAYAIPMIGRTLVIHDVVTREGGDETTPAERASTNGVAQTTAHEAAE
jgi:hypothetical protein